MAIPPVSPNQQTAGSSSNSAMDRTSSGMDTTFINLLTAELKAQDPTAPMDGNQMVSQMVALNQLDQLIAIRQTLQVATIPSQSANNTSATEGN